MWVVLERWQQEVGGDCQLYSLGRKTPIELWPVKELHVNMRWWWGAKIWYVIVCTSPCKITEIRAIALSAKLTSQVSSTLCDEISLGRSSRKLECLYGPSAGHKYGDPWKKSLQVALLASATAPRHGVVWPATRHFLHRNCGELSWHSCI